MAFPNGLASFQRRNYGGHFGLSDDEEEKRARLLNSNALRNGAVYGSMPRPGGLQDRLSGQYWKSMADPANAHSSAHAPMLTGQHKGMLSYRGQGYGPNPMYPPPQTFGAPRKPVRLPGTYDTPGPLSMGGPIDGSLEGAPRYTVGNDFASATGKRRIYVGESPTGGISLTGEKRPDGVVPPQNGENPSLLLAYQRKSARDQLFADGRILRNAQQFGLPKNTPAVADAIARADEKKFDAGLSQKAKTAKVQEGMMSSEQKDRIAALEEARHEAMLEHIKTLPPEERFKAIGTALQAERDAFAKPKPDLQKQKVEDALRQGGIPKAAIKPLDMKNDLGGSLLKDGDAGKNFDTRGTAVESPKGLKSIAAAIKQKKSVAEMLSRMSPEQRRSFALQINQGFPMFEHTARDVGAGDFPEVAADPTGRGNATAAVATPTPRGLPRTKKPPVKKTGGLMDYIRGLI